MSDDYDMQDPYSDLSGNEGPISFNDIPVDPNAASNWMTDPGMEAPTQSDIQWLKDQGYSQEEINQVLGNVAATNPAWTNAIKALLPAGTTLPKTNLPTGGPGGSTTPPGSSGPPGLSNLFNSFGNMAPGILQAIDKFGQSGDYKKWAQEGADRADPFGPQRGQYQTQLNDLYKDPSKIADTPGYKFALSQGLGAVANRDNNKFGLGAGSTSVDMQNYAQGLASQTFNQERNSLMQLAGANFSPSNAGSLYAAGMNASALEHTGAMGALGQALQASAVPTSTQPTTPTIPNFSTVDDINNHIIGTPPPTGTSTSTITDSYPVVNASPTPDPNSPNGNNGVIPGGT